MQVFMVERQLGEISLSDLSGLKARAVRAAALMYEAGDRVRYVRSVFVPGDGRCLCLFEGKNQAVIEELNRDAGLPYERIVAAMDVGP
jgi:hypothetical protein